jgi:hypothetical protein
MPAHQQATGIGCKQKTDTLQFDIHMWTEIKDNSDIDKLMNAYGFFHDSCLRDIYITTREFVDNNLAMHFDNKLSATLLFQRQFGPNTVIELQVGFFTGLTSLTGKSVTMTPYGLADKSYFGGLDQN